MRRDLDLDNTEIVTGCKIHLVEQIVLDEVLNVSNTVLHDLQVHTISFHRVSEINSGVYRIYFNQRQNMFVRSFMASEVIAETFLACKHYKHTHISLNDS